MMQGTVPRPPPGLTRQLLNCAASKGVRKPSVPIAKHITGGSGVSSANKEARCLQDR